MTTGASGTGDQPDSTVVVEDVVGEPVSRTEAGSMGLAGFDLGTPQPAGPGFRRVDAALEGTDGPPAQLEQALTLLGRDRADMALPLAMEASLENPDLPGPKVAVARCHLDQGDYAKALAVMDTVADEELDADAHYWKARMLLAVGRKKEADAAAKRALAGLPGSDTVKLATALLERLRNEAAARHSTTHSAIKRAAAREERRGRTRSGVIAWLVAAALVLAVLYFAAVAMAVFAPDRYAGFRDRLPAGWTFLPDAELPAATPPAPAVEEAAPRTRPSGVSRPRWRKTPRRHILAGAGERANGPQTSDRG